VGRSIARVEELHTRLEERVTYGRARLADIEVARLDLLTQR
jgi:hypothetical protein